MKVENLNGPEGPRRPTFESGTIASVHQAVEFERDKRRNHKRGKEEYPEPDPTRLLQTSDKEASAEQEAKVEPPPHINVIA